MKKKVFWLAAMAVTVSMASCSLEEVVEQPTPQAIGFSSFVGKPTKAATEIVNPGSTGGTGTALSKFYVFGKYGGSSNSYEKDVFSNTEVTVTDVNTEISTTQYWIANKYYKFVAYSDGNSSIGTTTGTGTASVSIDNSVNITISDYEAGDKDLILATPTEVTAQTDASSYGVVGLSFSHLLSQVSFQFKGESFPDGYQLQITGLTFTANNKSTYSYVGDPTNGYTWSDPVSGNTNVRTYVVNENSKFAFGTATKSDANFVIPRTYSTDIIAAFTATVYDKNGTQVSTKKFTTVSLLASSGPSIPGEWKAGCRYQYNLTITPANMGNMSPIKFKVDEVKGWQDEPSSGNGTDISAS